MRIASPRAGALLALVGATLALAAPLALGAEATRESYVAAVEPICRANTQANERILAGVKGEVRRGELKPAAAQFAKAARALKRTWHELAAVPRPTADEVRLLSWLGDIVGEIGLLEATAHKLKAGDKIGAERMSARLSHQAAIANDRVLPFEFHYCRAEPSRFT